MPTHRRTLRRLMSIVLAGAGLAGCTSDPSVWEGISQGLAAMEDQADREAANCYWAPPPGIPLGANQKYCPGDAGYRDIQLPASYYRDRYRDDRRDRRKDGHGGRERDRS